ncbi:MAG: DNA cytosine methyltransferase [Agathobaculum sp.]|uniref:DNA cytosine methyltransferase n=1 Tax=Agathobaculum sp. TaxID=2048138 RepID=UPI002A803879|nr:DNA cytosine methyltransferase [Agathobaculum sp.]MDY3710917.1 DNA cytosine methyltransferase [Agathobaculum sp.]
MSKAQISLWEEKIVDSFAGGGGASTGIELATGRVVDIAINHDPDAILMHKTNHPHTTHYQASVWDVDPLEVTHGSPVGLLWASPDCKHFSKAKGGKPVEKKIRGLAWIVLRWAGTVRPRVIILENVEEFRTWGPVRKGKPVKKLSGQTFHKWLGQLEALGYTVEWRELVAADYGAPTTRKRFFLIARCDGRPIVWPEPTHAPADSPEVKAGLKKPWRSAAEIIDWSLPAPSIFASKEEIRERYGVAAVRPLAKNTMRRVARGVDKFVIKSATPFIVPTGYGEAPGQQPRLHDINGPVPTAVGKCHHGVVSPVMAPLTMHNNENAAGTAITEPVNTITSSGAGGHQMLIAPTLAAIGQTGGGDRCRSVEEPTHTQVSKAEECVVCPAMIQYHTEQAEMVRGQAVTDPIMTIDASNRYGLAAASMIKYYSGDHVQNVADPLHTVTTRDREGVTVTHMVKLKGTNLGGPVTEPVQTITAGGGHHGVVTTRIAKAEPGAPLQNWPKIREALNEFCGYQLAEDDVILFLIGGAWYFMADIGLRMLTPRELYRANGFPDDYKIERDYMGNVYGKSKQVARCGNAVPPPFATALVRANFPEWCGQTITTMAEFEKAVAV